MRRYLAPWLLLLLAACGPLPVAGPGSTQPAETPFLHIVAPTPAFAQPPLAAWPTLSPRDSAPPTPVLSPAAPPGYIPPSQRPVPTPFVATAYPLPPTPTLAPPASPGRLLFSIPWPDTGPTAGTPGIAVGRDGTLFVTDVARPGIYRYSADGQPLGRWDIPPLPNGPPPPSQSPGARTLAVAGDGSLYMPLWDGMRRLTPDSGLLTSWPGSPPDGALSLAVGPDTTVYTINSQRSHVTRFTADGAQVGAWNGAQPGDPFRAASAVAVGPDGTVYVADQATSRVYLFAPDGRFLSAWLGPPNGQAEIYTPVALAVAPDGSVFVLEGRRRRVSRFDPTGRLIEWWDGPAEGGNTFTPTALAVAEGRVYVVDYGNQRVQAYGIAPLSHTRSAYNYQ